MRGWIAGALALGLGAASPALAQSGIEGVWLTPYAAEMTVAPCGAGFCGTLSRVAVSAEDLANFPDELSAMQSFLDDKNREASLRQRPILGLEILRVSPTGNPAVFEGEVYNPSDGNTYSGSLSVNGPLQVTLKGCALIVFCQEQVWQRLQ